MTRAEVQGVEPRSGPHTLRDYPVAAAVCAGYWLEPLNDWFIPQSIEVIGQRVLVGGYQRKSPRLGNHPCQIVELDPRTGRTIGFLPRWEAPVYSSKPTFCRHSGGMEADASGLWLVESSRLWLLDPDRLSDGEAGARHYLDPHEETIPAVLRLDRAAVLHGPEQHCRW